MRMQHLALVSILAWTGVATAKTLEGVTMQPTQEVDGTTLTLNGVGLRSKLMIKVYVAGLYLVQESSDANSILQGDQPKRMVLEFLRDVSREQMVDAYVEAFDTNAAAQAASLRSEIDGLLTAFEPVAKGDRMVFTYVPGRGTTLSIKGAQKVTIPGQPFSQAMFACWIGPKPPSADFKKGVLGQ